MSGTFKGTYHLTFLRVETADGEPVPWFLCELDAANPLTFITDAGIFIRPAGQFETDMGSVPPPLQGIAGPLASPRGYVCHDSAFDNHGWWESADQAKTWAFVRKTEAEVNDLLCDMCAADGVGWLEREAIHAGVDLGGTALWNNHLGPFPIDPPPPLVPVQWNPTDYSSPITVH